MTTTPTHPRSPTGTAAGVTAALIWSTTAPVIASANGVDPFLFAALNDGVAALLFVLAWVLRRKNPLPELRTIPLWFYALGFCGISVHGLTWIAAIQQAPALEATLIIYSWPLLLVIFTTISLRQRFRWYHLLACLLGMAGIATMLIGRGLDLGTFTLMPGHFWALVSALTWVAYSAVAARYTWRSSSFLGVIFALSALVNGAVWLYRGAPPAPIPSLLLVAIAGAFAGLAYALWDFGSKRGNAQLIAVVSFLTPVLAAVYLVLLGKAQASPHLVMALAMVVTGIGVASWFGRTGVSPRPNENGAPGDAV